MDASWSEIYTLSLHDALPISAARAAVGRALTQTADAVVGEVPPPWRQYLRGQVGDRKSTRLNSSHVAISYAVFCLKQKKKTAGSGRRDRRRTGRSESRLGGVL